MAGFRDHVYQGVNRFFLAVTKNGIWCISMVYRWWPGDPQPCGLENGDIDLRFPWIFPFLGEVMRDVQETSSEIQKKMT